jgi:hypothetical protein
MGCSDQSVPSLSNVAMRSGTATKSGDPGFVTRETKPTSACFAAPSFHEGSGSWAIGALAEASEGDEAEAGVALGVAGVTNDAGGASGGGFREHPTPRKLAVRSARRTGLVRIVDLALAQSVSR